MEQFRNFHLIALTLFVFQLAYAQTNTDQKTHYLAFDSIVGLSQTALYNGARYVDKYRAGKERPKFFKHYDFLEGNINYDGQMFYDLNLKYDLYNDVLITKLKGDKSFITIELNSLKLDAFTIAKHYFINLSGNDQLVDLNITGFLEQSYKGNNLNFYIKHIKKLREKIKGNKVSYYYDLRETYVLELQDNFYIVKSKNDLKKLFPSNAKDINAYYKMNRTKLNTDPNKFMRDLVQILDTPNSYTN